MCLVACCVSLFVHLGVLSRVKNIHTQFYYGQYVTLGAIRVHHVVHVLVCVFVIRGHLRIVLHGSHMIPHDSICKEPGTPLVSLYKGNALILGHVPQSAHLTKTRQCSVRM